MSGQIDVFAPNALPPVPVSVPADRWDNLVREWGVGYCCEWFGYSYSGEFAHQTVQTLQERHNESLARLSGAPQL